MSALGFVLEHIGSALRLSFAMFWQVLWPLALGFLLANGDLIWTRFRRERAERSEEIGTHSSGRSEP